MIDHIRIAGYQGERSVHTRAVRIMIEALLKEAGGQVSVSFESDITARGCKATDLLDPRELRRSGPLLLFIRLSDTSRPGAGPVRPSVPFPRSIGYPSAPGGTSWRNPPTRSRGAHR